MITPRVFPAPGLMCAGCGVSQHAVAWAWPRREPDDTILDDPALFPRFVQRSFRRRHAAHGSIIELPASIWPTFVPRATSSR